MSTETNDINPLSELYTVEFTNPDTGSQNVVAKVTYPPTVDIISLGHPDQISRKIAKERWPLRAATVLALAAAVATAYIGVDNILNPPINIPRIALGFAETYTALTAGAFTALYTARREGAFSAILSRWRETINPK